MKIRLAILEKDKSYLYRIVSVLNDKYTDKIELYTFTDQAIAFEKLELSRIDVFVANECFSIDTSTLPSRCGFAYLVDSPDMDSTKGQKAICKYQNVDLIYKQILNIYAEKTENNFGMGSGEASARVIVFCAPCGGVGTSSMAVAVAKSLASRNNKTLYLNLEKFGSSDLFLNGEGKFNMQDVIFSLKSKKTNLALKLASCVKQDQSGVYFYSAPEVALDMYELKAEDVLQLISGVKQTGGYDYIILDIDFSIDLESLNIIKQAQSVIFVSDGSDVANTKNLRAYQALAIMEQNYDLSITERISLIYNKFSSQTGKQIEGLRENTIGGAPRYDHATTSQVVEWLCTQEVIHQIVSQIGVYRNDG